MNLEQHQLSLSTYAQALLPIQQPSLIKRMGNHKNRLVSRTLSPWMCDGCALLLTSLFTVQVLVYIEKLAAADESEWKDNLEPMGAGPDIPRMFRTAAKVRRQSYAPT